MATSGSFSWTTSNQYIDAKVAWSLVSQDIAKNTSTIDVSISFTRTNTGYTTTRKWSGSIFCGANVGTNEQSTTSDTLTIVNGSYAVGQTMRVTIGHDSEGNCSFIVGSRGGSLTGGSVSDYTVPAYYERFDLPQIKRATTPTLSATTTEMGKSVTINCPRASSSFTHTLTYAWGSSSGTIASGVGTSYAWTIPLSFANNIPSATKGQGTITCKTYSGSTLIGSKDITFYATVPSSVVPSISSVALSDPNGYVSTYGAYVQSKSKVKVQVSASGSYSSTISSVSITVMGVTSTSNPYTSGLVSIAGGTGSVSVTVKDSRGRTASKSVNFSVLAYSTPAVSYIKARRCTSDGTIDEDNGEYVKVEYSASITSLNSKNGKSFTIQYKEASASSWTTIATYDSSYNCTGSCIADANVDKSYDVRIVAADTFSSTTSQNVVGTTFTTFDVKANGKGFGFGKAAETDDLLDIAWNIRDRGNLTVDGKMYTGSSEVLENNVTGGSSNDTAAFWASKKPGIYWFDQKGMLSSQPGQWGFLKHFRYGSDIFQIWHTQSNGAMYFRGANSSNSSMPDFKLIFEPSIQCRSYYAGGAAFAQECAGGNEIGTYAMNTSNYIRALFGISSNGTTHGFYSNSVGQWSVYVDGSGNQYLGNENTPFYRIRGKEQSYVKNGVLILHPQTLWSGTMATGGSATISNINKYNVYAVRLSDDTMLIGIRSTWAPDNTSGKLNATISYDGGGSVGSYNYKASFSISGTTVKLTSASKHKLLTSGTSHEGSNLNVTNIYGLF